VTAASTEGGIYGIGAVASMLAVPSATLRTWEDRYGVIAPHRTAGGRRLYSRTQIEHLRSVRNEMARGVSAADAHRSLARRLAEPAATGRAPGTDARLLVLVVERDEHGALLIEHFLSTEGFRVDVSLDPDEAMRIFQARRPDLVIVAFLVGGGAGEGVCRWLKERGAGPVLVVSALNARDRALTAGADAFLLKPLGHRLLVSVVNDLVGLGAMLSTRV
jgi:CheY-like chemotaxis protein